MTHDYTKAMTAIEKAGGLKTAADLARHWGVSAQRANVLVNDPTFPPPRFRFGRQSVWFALEADEWRNARRAG